MSSIFSIKKNIMASGLLQGMTDVHAHLLPGVDDGVASIEEAREAVDYLAGIGVKRMILTPHIMADIPENRPDRLREHLAAFQQEFQDRIEFRLAGEYMLDTGFRGHLDAGLLFFGGWHVLVETSYLSAPPDLHKMLYEICLNGFKPIIAHPERYQYMTKSDLLRLKRNGYKFQLNLMSLGGVYGKGVMHLAYELLSEGLYDFAGSDFHHCKVYMNAVSNLKLTSSQWRNVSKLLENNCALWQD